MHAVLFHLITLAFAFFGISAVADPIYHGIHQRSCQRFLSSTSVPIRTHDLELDWTQASEAKLFPSEAIKIEFDWRSPSELFAIFIFESDRIGTLHARLLEKPGEEGGAVGAAGPSLLDFAAQLSRSFFISRVQGDHLFFDEQVIQSWGVMAHNLLEDRTSTRALFPATRDPHGELQDKLDAIQQAYSRDPKRANNQKATE